MTQASFRAAAGVVKAATGCKGKALFHPIRTILTGEDSGPELDLAVPAIDHVAGLDGVTPGRTVPSCAERAQRVADALR